MSQLRQHHATLTAAGWIILGITPQRASAVATYSQAQGLPFPVLIDDDRSVTQRYGVYTIFSLEAPMPTINLPHNSTFLIDRGGIIRYVHIGLRSTDLPEEAALMAAMNAIP